MNNKLRGFFRIMAFLLIFFLLLTMVTLIFLPKWDCTKESAQMAGLYREPDDSIDVLCLGSCNMYTSVSPVMLYESCGLTAYDFCCPDQEMSTSYYCVKEALKTQKPKVVIVEALFMTCGNGKSREHYNRFALDYMPLSLNKLQLAAHIASTEADHMKQFDPTAPDKLLTFAGYIFPLLRYHSRTDLSMEDATFFLENDLYNYYKGGWPEYNYTTNDGNYYNKLFNKPALNDAAKEYFPKIKELCDENGIELLVMISPNHARWGYDDKQTKIVTDFAAELGVPVLNFHKDMDSNFEEYNYGYSTGRLNVFGAKKLSIKLGEYLTKNYGLKPTELTEENRAAWDACVDKYYALAEENGCCLEEGQIAQLSNLENAIRVRWNPCGDCTSYSIYRCTGKNGSFELLTDAAEGNIFDDPDVVNGQGYTYRIVPNEGADAGISSRDSYYVFVGMPTDLVAVSDNATVWLDWTGVDGADYYRIRRRTDASFNFERWDTTTNTCYRNSSSVRDGTEYYYRLCAVVKDGDATYSSETVIVQCVPVTTPQITACRSSDEGNVISWNKLPRADTITVLRRAEDESDFSECGVLSDNEESFTDSSAEAGVQYFYKIVSSFTTKVNGSHAVSADSNTVGIRTQ